MGMIVGNGTMIEPGGLRGTHRPTRPLARRYRQDLSDVKNPRSSDRLRIFAGPTSVGGTGASGTTQWSRHSHPGPARDTVLPRRISRGPGNNVRPAAFSPGGGPNLFRSEGRRRSVIPRGQLHSQVVRELSANSQCAYSKFLVVCQQLQRFLGGIDEAQL